MGTRPEELTQEKVEAFQLAAFRQALRYVKEHSNYYRETLKGIDPDEICKMEDIRRIPFTTESDLAENEWRFQCVRAADVTRAVTMPTTGTGGARKRLVYTAADQKKAIEFIHRGYLTMGCKKGERMLVFMSGNAPGSIGDLVRQAVCPIGMEVEVFGEITDIRPAYERMMAYRPAVVEAIPWHAAALARYGQKYGNPEKQFIRSVNLSADIVPDGITKRLRRLWDCTTHRHYGSTEMCIFGGVECIHENGYHLRHSDILFEIPRPDESGRGEIVVTTFAHEAMPLIRYRTGDIGRFTDLLCGCGAEVRRLEKIWGRESSILHVNDAAFFLSELSDIIFAEEEAVDFDAEICVDGQLRVTIRVLPGDRADLTGLRQRFAEIPGVKKTEKKPHVIWRQEDFITFPKGRGLKKTVKQAMH